MSKKWKKKMQNKIEDISVYFLITLNTYKYINLVCTKGNLSIAYTPYK